MNWLTLTIFIVGCELAGILGSVFTVRSIPTWYAALKKPQLSPPNWLFGPVWTLLYLLMGIAGYLLWQRRTESKVALVFFFIQLILNAIWTPLFFGAHKLGPAFFELVAMWLAILLTIIFAYSLDPKISYLLLPYLVWVTFAGYLNYSLWQLNPTRP